MAIKPKKHDIVGANAQISGDEAIRVAALDRMGRDPYDPKSMSEDDYLRLLSRFKRDFEFYSPRVLKIQTKASKLERFAPNRAQNLLNKIFDIVGKVRLKRFVILKARRMGISTLTGGRFYHKTSWNKNRYAVQITHEPEATDFLFKMIKRFYNLSPADLRPETLYNNTKLLEFNNKDGTGLDSAFRVATAGKDDFGSGQLIHYFHASELSKWEEGKVESLLTSVLQCVPDLPDTEIIIESTAKGLGGEFPDRFWGARFRIWVSKLDEHGEPVIEESINEDADESDIYTSIFLPWFVDDDNRMEPPSNFVLVGKDSPMFSKFGDEVAIKKEHNLDDWQMYWRRHTIVNKNRGNLKLFNQENPAKPFDAFIGSGSPVFDNEQILALKNAAPAPVARYECMTSIGQWSYKADGRLKVWEEPRPGNAYIIGADVAEGLEKGDFSYATVINHRTGDQVAEWHGHATPKDYANILASLGKRYNMAHIAPERNNHGMTVVTELVDVLRYPNVFMEMIIEPPQKPRRRYGWQTSSKTRPLILDNLIQEVQDCCHGIKSAEVFNEMLGFKIQKDGKMEADSGWFDDRVMGNAIAKYVRQRIPLPAMNRNPHHKQIAGGGGGRSNKSSAGWT